MKKQLLLFFVLLLTVTINAQWTIVDFEDDGVGKPDTNATAEWAGDPNVPVVTLVTNPSASGINTSANVVKYVETTSSHSGQSLQFAFDGTTAKTGHNMNANKFIKLMVYSENQTTFNILLELGTGGVPRFSEEKTVTTTLNTWTEVIFDFTGNGVAVTPANYALWNTNLRIHFNNGTAGAGDVYYVDNYVLDNVTYETVADGDWGAASNWYPASVPARVEDKVDLKHNMTYTGDISLTEMLIRVNKSLNVTGNFTTANKSNLWGGSSLIVSGTATGEFAYFRVLTEPAVGNLEGWHLVSSPVSGEQYNDTWISNYSIASGTGSNRGIATYNNGGGIGTYWDYAQAPVGDTDFDEGKGYSMKSTGGGTVQFTGSLRTSNVTDIALTKSGSNGYNLVGNTFAGYVSLDDLLTANDSGGNDLLTSSTIWVWNPTTKAYDAKTSSFQIAPGQGFFVEASAAASTFTINTSMLSAQSTDTFLKSSKTEIQLNITDGDLTRYAKINYLDNATTSFDNGSDGKLFGGISQPFTIYTELLSDNVGKKYQIQALPNSDLESMIIPVGVVADAGKEITFSADALNLPSGVKVFLEDKITNTFTRLDEASSNYKVTIRASLNGIGRFYLHTKSSALSTTDVLLDNISIYKTNNSNLRVVGLHQGNADVKIYNIIGKQVLSTSFKANGSNNVSLPNLTTGVYVIQLTTEAGKLNKKIILE